MPQIMLDSSKRVSSYDHLPCSLESLGSGKNALLCHVEPLGQDTIPLKLKGIRPPICELPSMAEKEAMGDCRYHYHSLKGCGCPILDPNKHPAIWKKYENAVLAEVSKQSLGRSNITLTFFASGYLLQDCKLILAVLEQLKRQKWGGQIKVQFIDFKYAASKVATVEKPIGISTEVSGYKVGAAVCGLAGVASFGIDYKRREEGKESPRTLQVLGGIFLLAAIITLIMEPSQEEERDLSERDVQIIKMPDQEAFDSIGSFLDIIQKQVPQNISLQSMFFGDADDCVRSGAKSDLLLGYDIGAGASLDSLRKNSLAQNGQTIVIANMDNKPVMIEGGRDQPQFKTSYI